MTSNVITARTPPDSPRRPRPRPFGPPGDRRRCHSLPGASMMSPSAGSGAQSAARARAARGLAAGDEKAPAPGSLRTASQSSLSSGIRSMASSTTWKTRSSRDRKRVLPLKYALATRPGRAVGGHSKRNQDAHAFRARLLGMGHVHLALVADGHGPVGHDVSRTVADEFPVLLEAELKAQQAERLFSGLESSLNAAKVRHLLDTCARAAQKACKDVHSEVGRRCDSSVSGSTLVACLLVGNHAITINVGDSRCVLGRAEGGQPCVGKRLTVDHDLTADGEQARIRSHSGVIRAYTLPDGTQAGPLRVWSPFEDLRKPGLAMSRSVGDEVAKRVGVVCDPALSYARLQMHRDFALCIASDGIWDVLDDTEVMRTAFEHGADVASSASSICDTAHARWLERTGPDGRVDDITAVIILLWPAADPAAREARSERASRRDSASTLSLRSTAHSDTGPLARSRGASSPTPSDASSASGAAAETEEPPGDAAAAVGDAAARYGAPPLLRIALSPREPTAAAPSAPPTVPPSAASSSSSGESKRRAGTSRSPMAEAGRSWLNSTRY